MKRFRLVANFLLSTLLLIFITTFHSTNSVAWSATVPEIETLIELSQPAALAIDISDINLYCVFYGSPALTTVNTTTGERTFGVPMLPPPGVPLVSDIDISYDDGYLYISDGNYGQIILMEIGGEANTISGIQYPTGLAVDHKREHLYVTDVSTHSIYDVDLISSSVSLLAGSGTAGDSNGIGADASFNTPVGIAIDPSDTRLYVAESGNNRIREIEIASKSVTILAGSGSKVTTDGIGTSASFNDPAYITTNRQGTKLYVIEFDGGSVREINIDTKEVSTLIDHTYGLNQPRDIVISHDDSTLYLADYGNNRILKIVLTSNNRPTATITSPADGYTFSEGDEITFTGTGTDPEDGELTGNHLVWTSDKDGEIGTGTSFTIDSLSAGVHTITLTATDYDGAMGTDSITIATESPWPMFRHDPQHSSQSSCLGPQTGNLKWTYSGGINGFPIVSPDGTIYVGGEVNTGDLIAIHRDGSLKWTISNLSNVFGTLTIGKSGTIYLAERYLYAIDAAGTIKWTFNPGRFVESSPLIGNDGSIFIGTQDLDGPDVLYAVNSDGTLKWTFTFHENQSGIVYPALSPNGDIIYVTAGCRSQGCQGYKLYAIDLNGNLKWNFDAVIPTPSIGLSGTIYSMDNQETSLLAIRPDGILKWKKDFDEDQRLLGISQNETIYVSHTRASESTLTALDSDGNIKWSYDTEGSLESIAIGSDGTIYFVAHYPYSVPYGRVSALTPTGLVLWETTLDDASVNRVTWVCT